MMGWAIEAAFPISRDPPEGGTSLFNRASLWAYWEFPISRDPPEGGTRWLPWRVGCSGIVSNF